VQDEDGNEAETVKEVLYEPPRDTTRTREQIEKHLTSTGNTPYNVTGLTIQPREPGFLPAGMLNSIRRDVLEMLTCIRFETYPRQNIEFTQSNAPYPEKTLDFRANIFNTLAKRFYERHGATITEPAFEALADTTGKTVMTTRYCILHQLGMCPKEPQSCRLIQEPLRMRDAHHTYRLEFDCRQCRMFLIMEGK
jgi:23S rRNA 5-hydroxycytidine C2501 synthase